VPLLASKVLADLSKVARRAWHTRVRKKISIQKYTSWTLYHNRFSPQKQKKKIKLIEKNYPFVETINKQRIPREWIKIAFFLYKKCREPGRGRCGRTGLDLDRRLGPEKGTWSGLFWFGRLLIVCGDEIRTRLAVLETGKPFCGGNGSTTRARGRRGPSAGEQSAIDKRFVLKGIRGCCRVVFFFFFFFVAGSISMHLRVSFMSVAVALLFIGSVADASIWSKCRTIDYISTCSNLCDVEVGARSVYFTGRVLMWGCLLSTVTVRKTLNSKVKSIFFF
jgi:hypothetical protein